MPLPKDFVPPRAEPTQIPDAIGVSVVTMPFPIYSVAINNNTPNWLFIESQSRPGQWLLPYQYGVIINFLPAFTTFKITQSDTGPNGLVIPTPNPSPNAQSDTVDVVCYDVPGNSTGGPGYNASGSGIVDSTGTIDNLLKSGLVNGGDVVISNPNSDAALAISEAAIPTQYGDWDGQIAVTSGLIGGSPPVTNMADIIALPNGVIPEVTYADLDGTITPTYVTRGPFIKPPQYMDAIRVIQSPLDPTKRARQYRVGYSNNVGGPWTWFYDSGDMGSDPEGSVADTGILQSDRFSPNIDRNASYYRLEAVQLYGTVWRVNDFQLFIDDIYPLPIKQIAPNNEAVIKYIRLSRVNTTGVAIPGSGILTYRTTNLYKNGIAQGLKWVVSNAIPAYGTIVDAEIPIFFGGIHGNLNMAKVVIYAPAAGAGVITQMTCFYKYVDFTTGEDY